jgi:hypothetical protein
MQRKKSAPKTPKKQRGVKSRKAPKTAGATTSAVSVPFAGLTLSNSKPTFNGRQSVRVVHREAVASVRNTVTNDFAMLPQVGQTPGWDISPGNPVLFPWLSNIAVNYEQYHFHKLVFSLVSGQAANLSGRVYMAVDYDWDDEIATTYQGMMNNQSSVEGMVWQSLRLNCSPQLLHDDRYYKYTMNPVREAPEPRTTFGGFLMIATNVPGVYTWDLLVEYDVEFRSPQGSGVPQLIKSNTTSMPLMIGPVSANSKAVVPPLPELPGTVRIPVPNSVQFDGLPLGGAQAYDLGQFPPALVDTEVEFSQSNIAPVTLMGLCSANPLRYLFYDSLWNHLGDSMGLTGFSSTLSAKTPSSVTTPGAPMVASTPLSIVAARAAHAALRYAIPWLNLGTLAAIQNPTGSTWIKTEL